MGRVISYLLFSNKNRHRQKQNKRLFNIYLNYYTKMYYKEFKCFTCFYIGSNRSDYILLVFIWLFVICSMVSCLMNLIIIDVFRKFAMKLKPMCRLAKKNNTSLDQYLSEDRSIVKTSRNTRSNVYNQAYSMMYYLKLYGQLTSYHV